MLQQTLMFLASDTPSTQAIPLTPPAALPASFPAPGAETSSGIRWKFAFEVLANAAGLAGFLASLWFFLVLMQSFI